MDVTREWTWQARNGQRHFLHVWFASGVLRLRGNRGDRVGLAYRRGRGNAVCYCEQGTIQEFSLRLFGFRLYATYSADRVKRPCHCDRALADLGYEVA